MGRINQLLTTLNDLGAAAEPVSVEALVQATGLHTDRVSNVVSILVARGLAERPCKGLCSLTDAGREALTVGGINDKPGPKGTGQRRLSGTQELTLRQKAWAALRLKKKASARDLVTVAGRGDESAAINNIVKYLRALERAGFAARLQRRAQGTEPTSPGFVRWTLIRDTGPLTPRWNNRRNEVYDPNTNTVHSCEVPTHD